MTSRTDTALVHQYYPFQVSQQSPALVALRRLVIAEKLGKSSTDAPGLCLFLISTKYAPQPIPTRAALQSSQQLMTLVQAPLLKSVQETAVCTRVYTAGSESPSPSDDSIFCVAVVTWTGTFTAK